MRIVVVGATGTIGKAVVAALGDRHEIVVVGRRGGQHQVDVTDSSSIKALLDSFVRAAAIELPRGQRINSSAPA
jgi:nucleoside-diphosphate-sugar epimerase